MGPQYHITHPEYENFTNTENYEVLRKKLEEIYKKRIYNTVSLQGEIEQRMNSNKEKRELHLSNLCMAVDNIGVDETLLDAAKLLLDYWYEFGEEYCIRPPIKIDNDDTPGSSGESIYLDWHNEKTEAMYTLRLHIYNDEIMCQIIQHGVEYIMSNGLEVDDLFNYLKEELSEL